MYQYARGIGGLGILRWSTLDPVESERLEFRLYRGA